MNQSPQLIQISLALSNLFFVVAGSHPRSILITCHISSSPAWLWQLLTCLCYPWLFCGGPVRYFARCPLAGICLMFFSRLNWGYTFMRGRALSECDLSSRPINITSLLMWQVICHLWPCSLTGDTFYKFFSGLSWPKESLTEGRSHLKVQNTNLAGRLSPRCRNAWLGLCPSFASLLRQKLGPEFSCAPSSGHWGLRARSETLPRISVCFWSTEEATHGNQILLFQAVQKGILSAWVFTLINI